MQKGIYQELSSLMAERLANRFQPYEVRSSLIQIAQRWKHILTEPEKKKVARILGGNRYAKTTHEMLETLFEEMLQNHAGD